jgi:hypothetical protein
MPSRGKERQPSLHLWSGLTFMDSMQSDSARLAAGPAGGPVTGPAGGPAAEPPPGRARRTSLAARLARQHGLFGAVLLVAAAVRLVAMLAYPGPLLYPDSLPYAGAAQDLVPGQLRPLGYSIMLRGLEPLHSLAAVIIVQHLMGLTMGVLGYALLRRYKLPDWGATLAIVPVLLSAYAVQMEHELLSDTLFAFLVLIAVVVMAWWPDPPLWPCALAGVLLAAAAVVRTQGVPLLIVFVIYLLIKFAGWRTVASIAVICVACAFPLAEYADWFHKTHGSWNLTTSDGAFLYAEASTFADCARIHPPADERFLCLKVPVSERAGTAVFYLFATDPLRNVSGGLAGNRADKLGLDFALRAIGAQPLDYLRAAGENFAETFALHGGHSRFGSIPWEATKSELDYMFPAAPADLMFPHTAAVLTWDGAAPDVRVVHPYSTFILAYQRYIVLPGPLLGVIALTGLVGLIVSWRRRGGPALLPWLTGMALLLIPAAILFDVRFIICAVPPLCVAAGIGAQQIAERNARR